MLLLLQLSCSSAGLPPGLVEDAETGRRFLSIDAALGAGAERILLGPGTFIQPCAEHGLTRVEVTGSGRGVTVMRRGRCDQSELVAPGPITIQDLTLQDAGLYASTTSTVTLRNLEITGWTGRDTREALLVAASDGYRVSGLRVHGNTFGAGDGLYFQSGGSIRNLVFRDNTVTHGYLLYVHEGVLQDAIIERNTRNERNPGFSLVEVHDTDLVDVTFRDNELNGPTLSLSGTGTARRLTLEDDSSAWQASIQLVPGADYYLRRGQVDRADGIWMEPGSRLGLEDMWLNSGADCEVRCGDRCIAETETIECDNPL